MSKEQGYELVIQFEDQSASFVHGFEAGTIYGRMKERRHVIEETVHATNAEAMLHLTYPTPSGRVWG